MKNSAKICAVIVLSAAVLCSCSKAPNEGSSENYAIARVQVSETNTTENDYVGYTFEYPKSWTVLRNDGMISVQSSEDNPLERVTISCTTFDQYDTTIPVSVYWDGDGTEENPGYYKQMQNTIGGDFKEISRKELKLGNTEAPALLVTYSAQIVDQTYMFSQVVSIVEGSVYTFTYTALPDSFETWSSALTHAVTSFKLK